MPECAISQKTFIAYDVPGSHEDEPCRKDVTGWTLPEIVKHFNEAGSNSRCFRLVFEEVLTRVISGDSVRYKAADRAVATRDFIVVDLAGAEDDPQVVLGGDRSVPLSNYLENKLALVVTRDGRVLHEPEGRPYGWLLAGDDVKAEKRPAFADFVSKIEWPSPLQG